MNTQYLEYCKKEIQEYLDKGLIRDSKSPWSCSAFYVMNAAEQERGAPTLVINYKPLNKVLKWIRYPLPNKQDLIKRLNHASIFSKFHMKSGYYQIVVKEEDKYKTNPKPWDNDMTEVVKRIKLIVKRLPCLGIPDPEAYLIVETDASDLGYGGILKQRILSSKEQIARKMSKSSKDQYGSPLRTPNQTSSNIVNRSLAPKAIGSNTPLRPLASTSSQRKTFLATIKKEPQTTSSNKYSPLSFLDKYQSPVPTSIPTPSKQLSHITPPISTPSGSKSYEEEYILKDENIDIMPIEPDWKKLSPTNLASRIFPEEYHYLPTYKSRIFYEFILIDTDSIELTHTRDDQKILKIITPDEWNQPLYKTNNFTRTFEPQQYSYYDYIDGWTNFLYLHPKTHSWFIWFRRGISLKFPKWFLEWFIKFGLEIFPNEVSEVFNYFKQKTTFLTGYKFISFIVSQNITWIMSWDYEYRQPYSNNNLLLLTRSIKVKWWKKFDINLLSLKRIDDWVKTSSLGITKPSKDLDEETKFLAEKSKIMVELASATSQDEFEERLKLIQALQDPSQKEETGSSDSVSTNPYNMFH
uniref:Polyprotein n=1 Tax=Cajanus cajan TaxID=3821 RepID=A0A151QVP5_CAJCA|nr:polyprotein [Cajanus cajan]